MALHALFSVLITDGPRVPLMTANRCAPPFCRSTRSTARDEEERFSVRSQERADRLLAGLSELGLDASDIDALLNSQEFRGSAALRTYLSFVYPKSDGALANAEKPGRHATIAQSIAFLIREHRAEKAAWLRNHDRAVAEVSGLRKHPLHLVLDNVRSAHNVGNLYRAAEAARIECVHACGITPTPPEPKLLKTAMGAAEYVPHRHDGSTLRVVKELQASGVAVWACETSERSCDLRDVELPQPLALVLGNELIGVDTEVLKIADGIVEIPCFGVKNSLNVATAGSVVMWEAIRQWHSQVHEVGAEKIDRVDRSAVE
mmetsp:Transcript_13196/g.33820  ORF Transcript_13196/g.33820 Transcript_13196/m.33820 type:complete len:317 (+) Transcript_13196:8-958(+)